MAKNSKGTDRVDVIVCTVNLLEYTKLAFASLYKNTKVPFNLIVVDINSTDGTQEWLKSLEEEHANVTLHFKEKRDKGFAEGFNTGLEYCTNPYVASFHSDMLVTRQGWLRHMIPLFKDKTVAYVGSKLLYPDGRIQHAGASFSKDLEWYHIGRYTSGTQFPETFEVPGVTGAGSVIRREAIPRGLPAFYERAEYSDVEVSCQLRADGWKILYCGSAILYHTESQSKKTWDWEALRKRYMQHKKTFQERWGNFLADDMRKNKEIYSH